MQYIIDRFEGNYAVCEDVEKNMINILRTQLPCESKEGSKIKKTKGGYSIVDNVEDRKRIQRKISKLLK